jgi:glycosyltransferase involved in cell wall biosynthesis
MLDYMAYGLPVVTTECGARGIETNNKQLMIVSSLNDFIDSIKLLSMDTVLYKQLSENGKNLAVKRYDWKDISNRLQNIILERLK